MLYLSCVAFNYGLEIAYVYYVRMCVGISATLQLAEVPTSEPETICYCIQREKWRKSNDNG